MVEIDIEMPEIKTLDLQPNTMYRCKLINGETLSMYVENKAITLNIEKPEEAEQKTSLYLYSDRVWLSDRCKQE